MSTLPSDDQKPAAVTPPPAAGPPLSAFPKAVWVILLLLAYAGFLAWNYSPAIFTPDDNGYYAQGTLLAATGKTSFRPISPAQYIDFNWLPSPSGDYYSLFAPGLAGPIALITRLFGPKASVALNPILAVLGILGLFLLVRMELGFAWGLAAAALLAMNPTYNLHAITCDAHMAVTVLLTWGLGLLLLWSREGRRWQALLGGLLLGCIPAIRYPEALYGLGIGMFLLGHRRGRARARPDILAAGLAALIPIVPLLWRNQSSFGAFWRTSYSFANGQTGFGLEHFRTHFVQYLQNLQGHGIGLFFPLGVIGITLLCGDRKTRTLGVCLTLLTVPTTLLYMAYYWGPAMLPQGTMRYLLPTFPLYFLAGLWALREFLSGTTPARRYAVMAALLGLQACWGAFTSAAELRMIRGQKRVLAIAAGGLEQYVPDGSVVAASPQLLQHLDFIRRWRLADPSLLRAVRRRADPDDGALRSMRTDRRPARTTKYDGLPPGGREQTFADDVLAWAGEGKVFYIGTKDEIPVTQGTWFHPDNFKILARLPLPETPNFRNRGGTDRSLLREDEQSGARARGRRGGGLLDRIRELDFARGAAELVIAEWRPRFRTRHLPKQKT